MERLDIRAQSLVAIVALLASAACSERRASPERYPLLEPRLTSGRSQMQDVGRGLPVLSPSPPALPRVAGS